MRLAAVTRLVWLTLLASLSLLLAVVGAFLVPANLPRRAALVLALGVRPLAEIVVGISLGVVLAVVGNYAIALQARRVGRSTAATALPALVWLAAVITIAGGRREGDVVLTGSAASLSFIVLGAVAAAVGIARRPRPRPDPEPEPGHESDAAADPTPE